jgi:hypothetical protein
MVRAVMSDIKRRFPRYPANLRLRLHLPGGELETTTEDIGLAGFSAPCTPLPAIGAHFGFVIHLPDNRQLAGEVGVVRATPDGVAGFNAAFSAAHQSDWETFIQQEAASGGLWRMISRYAVNQGEEKETARSVLEKGPLGILFKRIGGGPDVEPEGVPHVTRLHMVGENGEAYRIAFEKHPGLRPEESELGKTSPEFLELARLTVARVLPEPVYLKRSPQAQILPAQVVEMIKGGYGLVSLHFDSPPSLVGLHGAELIAIEIDGKNVFPFFDAADLDRIAHDNFRRSVTATPEPEPPLIAATLSEEKFSDSYEHRELATQAPATCSLIDLNTAMRAAKKVQTRSYGARSIRLFPELWLEVRRPKMWTGPVRGFAMEDGAQLCCFVLVGPDAPRVVPLLPTDQLSMIRGLKAGQPPQ